MSIKLTDLVSINFNTINEKNVGEDKYRLFFDIEGELSAKGDVIQFAYIVTDWDFNIIETYNKYFLNEHPISSAAQKVHLLTEEFLYNNTTTFFFEELRKLPFITREYKNVMCISYTNFDIQKIQNVYAEVYNKSFKIDKHLSSLNHAPIGLCYLDIYKDRKRKLSSLFTKDEFIEIDEEFQQISKSSRNHLHDGLYDTFLLYKLARKEA